jgi:hypothetical protein
MTRKSQRPKRIANTELVAVRGGVFSTDIIIIEEPVPLPGPGLPPVLAQPGLRQN